MNEETDVPKITIRVHSVCIRPEHKRYDTINMKCTTREVHESSESSDAYDDAQGYDALSSTPPRTRILRNSKINHQHRQSRSCKGHSPKRHRHRHRLRYFDWPANSPETLLSRVIKDGRKIINSQLSLLMNSDDLVVGASAEAKNRFDKRAMARKRSNERDRKLDSELLAEPPEPPGRFLNTKVESSNRFLSLSCKLVKTAIQWRSAPESGRNRADFHDSLSSRIKSGSAENKDKPCRRQLSREEHLWQTELKDMIWLELQAWIAERSPTEQDHYLCDMRHQLIPTLLDDFLNYKFEKKPDSSSSVSQDSGIGSETGPPCPGCLWVFCAPCMESSNVSIREVETLIKRLELVESLYPSSKALGNQYPVYKSPEFSNKVKAMCSWFNIQRQLRLKLLILGKQLVSCAQEGCSERSYSCEEIENEWEFSNVDPLSSIGNYFKEIDCGDKRTYRKYMENVLKVRGLRKALHFLDNVYSQVLRKGRIALEKPLEDQSSSSTCKDPDGESELRRFGCWSPEFQATSLPSFRPAFLFICRIPLDLLHEFLRMRLESKVEKPSCLSIRQLIRELREGIRLSVLNKQRYAELCTIALSGLELEECGHYLNYMDNFNQSLQEVFKLYLNYMEQWVSLTQHEKLRKNILEEEWQFVALHAPHIPNGNDIAGSIFCKVTTSMLSALTGQLINNVNELKPEFFDVEGSNVSTPPRQSVLHLSRKIHVISADTRERTIRVLSLTKTLVKDLESDTMSPNVEEALKELKEIILSVEKNLLSPYLEVQDDEAVRSRCREVLHSMYRFTLEYHREVVKIAPDKCQYAHCVFRIAQQWIAFVITYCERGKGTRPRWANAGLEFLMFAADPKYTGCLADREFEVLKGDIEKCIAHVVGTPPSSPSAGFVGFTRATSPSPRSEKRNQSAAPSPQTELNPFDAILLAHSPGVAKRERILKAIQRLDETMDEKLRNSDLIGTVSTVTESPKNHLRLHTVNFPWQRGTKIGQGRFGKVYTAVNTDTGELMAMKEISLQPNDIRTIKRVGLEFQIFEGIHHDHLIRYYGAEIHREELLIFMELCPEGTLESLVASTENGLPEGAVRRYTSQLVSAIDTLHVRSIVHRDIKPANIFLTSEGNRLKLGDFGSSERIKAHTTAPGELKGFVGTQAYMAPEVFMDLNTSGHGRAVDIWSLGCVVIEMASGKRPWFEYDSNYQIMFRVGMGETPTIPSTLSDEGFDFVTSCLKHNPKKRATTSILKDHTFLKVDPDDCPNYTTSSALENYLNF